MRVESICLLLFVGLIADCSCLDDESKSVDSASVSFLPSFIYHLESEFEVKPHGIPYMGTCGVAQENESKDLETPREDSVNPEDSDTLKESAIVSSVKEQEPKMVQSPTSYSFINQRGALRSDYFDDPKGNRNDRKFFIFGGDEPAEPSLEELLEENKTSNGVLLVDFYATWCRPCNVMAHHLEAIKETYRDDKLKIHKVDVDKKADYASKYKVTALPTLVLFTRGQEAKRIVGLVEVDKLMEEIDQLLSGTD
ncbi:thioredoxin, putative [Theileria equi strain WA]|uniref:Thioredoxin, putative n=1 Tax=Theileria equi strain WA TaxID=1537102 RepID=L0AXT6_THEEQ|nr:thioredoxin, putative [Theileria equi strain WA]AFZ80068.1 thioredoxin, putative [Theileria equi strain WA]|eukprot:XP_004829734.1 thioredoxin, putative [Theileria equi strain WA]